MGAAGGGRPRGGRPRGAALSKRPWGAAGGHASRCEPGHSGRAAVHGRVEGVLLEDVRAPQCVRAAEVADAGEHLLRVGVRGVRGGSSKGSVPIGVRVRGQGEGEG